MVEVVHYSYFSSQICSISIVYCNIPRLFCLTLRSHYIIMPRRGSKKKKKKPFQVQTPQQQPKGKVEKKYVIPTRDNWASNWEGLVGIIPRKSSGSFTLRGLLGAPGLSLYLRGNHFRYGVLLFQPGACQIRPIFGGTRCVD